MGAYTLRNVQGDLHKAWKIAAASKDLTMQDYCFLALRLLIKQDFQKTPESKEGVKRDEH